MTLSRLGTYDPGSTSSENEPSWTALPEIGHGLGQASWSDGGLSKVPSLPVSVLTPSGREEEGTELPALVRPPWQVLSPVGPVWEGLSSPLTGPTTPGPGARPTEHRGPATSSPRLSQRPGPVPVGPGPSGAVPRVHTSGHSAPVSEGTSRRRGRLP